MPRPNQNEPKDLWIVDGSLRDVRIFNTGLGDWEELLTLALGRPHVYVRDGVAGPAPKVQAILQETDHAHLLSIRAGRIWINCHFFSPYEIELDIDPREIKGSEDHNSVLDFIEELSKATQKNVVLTAENSTDGVLLRFDPLIRSWHVYGDARSDSPAFYRAARDRFPSGSLGAQSRQSICNFPLVNCLSLRELFAPWGELRSQPACDWTGDFQLPEPVANFYEEVGPWGKIDFPTVGPTGLSLDVGGNPVCIPPLHKLWGLQAGYRWSSMTNSRLADWKDEWLAVAEAGGDPFILDCKTGEVLFALHGAGVWDARRIAPTLDAAFGSVVTVANTMAELGEAAFDETFELTQDARVNVEESLARYLGDKTQATELLSAWMWYA